MSAVPVAEDSELHLVPPGRVPGLNALARGLMTKDPAVAPFLPDAPELPVIAERARAVLAAFRPRDASRVPAPLQELAAGRRAGVFTGQQVGLFTGPLLTMTKALAALDLASALGRADVPASGVFWCASEDHDLAEVTRFVVPTPSGPVDKGPDTSYFTANRRPVGALPIELDVPALLEEAAIAAGRRDDEAIAALASLNAGRTFREAFVETLDWLLGGAGPPTVDAARREDKPDVAALAARLVTERAAVRAILDERARALEKAGHPLQVKTDPSALPLFAIVRGERWLLREEGSRLVLKGHPDEATYAPEEVAARFLDGSWLPSFSALSRPLAQSTLFPVAAVVLGPSEIAYWAQSLPLFEWASIVRPVIVPRVMVALVEPPVRRVMQKLSLGFEEVLEGVDAILTARGAESAAGLIGRLEGVRTDALARLDALRPELLAIDDSLGKALDATREKVEFALGKLEEKAAAAAGRHQDNAAQRVARLCAALQPGGELAERVVTPASYVMTLGRDGLLAAMRRGVSWDRFGITVIDA